jgi:hypothetical protein
VWWPGAAEVLVLSCALGLLLAGHCAREETPDADVPAASADRDQADDDAADDDTADDDAADDDAADDDAAGAWATDEEADDAPDDHASDDDASGAALRETNARASGALDLAEKYESEGEYLACAQALAPIRWRLSMVENGDLIEAVETTFNRCDEELEKQYEPIEAKGCDLEIEDAIAVTAAPPRLVPRAAKAACLALVPGSSGIQAPDDGSRVCPRVALVWSAGGLHRRELRFDGGPLGDDGWCCNLESIAAGTLDGKTLVRVGGSGHPCGGGTAYEATQALYEWNGKSLASPLDLSIAFH